MTVKNFWQELPKPFFVLAPMEDVTDTVFRQMVVGFGRPDVFFTEFTNVDGMCHFLSSRPEQGGVEGSLDFARDDRQNPVLQRLCFATAEKPIVAQIWGKDPEKFLIAAKMVKKLGFDGIDINMGCPEKEVLKVGGGGALIGENSQVSEIVAAVKEGAGGLPVSVKTRIGNKTSTTEDWIGFLLTLDLAAISIHVRTVKEKSEGVAHWEEIGKCVKLRDCQLSSRAKSRDPFRSEKNGEGLRDSSTRSDELGWNDNEGPLIIGNGDVKSLEEAREKTEKYGVDGVMIGRGIFENLAVFDKSGKKLTPAEKLEALVAHTKLFNQTWGDRKDFQIIKKFVKAYVNGFEGAAAMRVKLMVTRNAEELLVLLDRLIKC